MKNIQTQRLNKQNHLGNHTRGQTKVVIGAWNRRHSIVEKQFQTTMFFLRKVSGQ